MEDINAVRRTVAAKYSSACDNILHRINQGLVRQLTSAVTQSLYLDVVYRGNDKTNFSHRATDKDLILLADALSPHVDVRFGPPRSSGTWTSPSTS